MTARKGLLDSEDLTQRRKGAKKDLTNGIPDVDLALLLLKLANFIPILADS